jgi:RimJ/RimL family protein N-acetyltransferase
MRHPFLVGERLYLRKLEETDLQGPYFQWFNDQEGDRYTNHAAFPNSMSRMKAFFDRVTQGNTDLVLAIVLKDGDRHVGNVALHGISWQHRRAELRIIIGEADARGKGYGTEAMKLLLRHAFEKLNLHRVFLGVRADHTQAIRAYEKCGFVVEGRLREDFLRNGAWHDTLRMSILEQDFLGCR